MKKRLVIYANLSQVVKQAENRGVKMSNVRPDSETFTLMEYL
jgi:hypothetical protein